MANLVTSGWTAGANVSAYPGSALALSRGEAQAAGSAIETVAASAAGVATHTTLANDTGYVLQQANAARTVRARIADSVTETGRATATGTTSVGSASVTAVTVTSGTIVVGQRITGPGIPSGTRVKAFSAGTITLTDKATAAGTGVALELSGAKEPRARVLRERDKRGTS